MSVKYYWGTRFFHVRQSDKSPYREPLVRVRKQPSRGETSFALSACFASADKSQTGKVGLLRSTQLHVCLCGWT